MAIVHFKREGQKLVPADQWSIDAIMKFKEDEVISSTLKKTRNYEFHKKFFSLMNLLWDNSPRNMPFKVFRQYAVASSGHGFVQDGVLIADSISFESMDELEFQQVYNDVLQFGIDHIGADRETIEHELMNYL